jgi:hypothetical protein
MANLAWLPGVVNFFPRSIISLNDIRMSEIGETEGGKVEGRPSAAVDRRKS